MEGIDPTKILSYTKEGEEIYGLKNLLEYIHKRWQGNLLDTDNALPISIYVEDRDSAVYIMKPPVYERDDGFPIFEQVLKTSVDISTIATRLGIKGAWELFNTILKSKEKEHYTNIKNIYK